MLVLEKSVKSYKTQNNCFTLVQPKSTTPATVIGNGPSSKAKMFFKSFHSQRRRGYNSLTIREKIDSKVTNSVSLEKGLFLLNHSF